MRENARVLTIAAPPPPAITCEQLGKLDVPVTIARGALTRTFYRVAADAAAACIHGSKRLVIDGARHTWPIQDPAAFDALLLAAIHTN